MKVKIFRIFSKIRQSLFPLFLVLTFSSCAFLLDESRQNPQSWQDAMTTAPIRDEVAKDYVRQLGKRLAALEPDQNWQIQSVLVRIPSTSGIQGNSPFDSGEINISRGMLNILSNEAELACLIGHEIGHKILHYDKRRYDREKSDWKDILLSDEMAESRWSKAMEQEADEYGAKLCRKAGYNPHAFLGFFERMATFQGSGLLRQLRELTSTHKDFRNRAQNLRTFLEREKMPDVGSLGEKQYRQNLGGLQNIQTTDVVNEVMPGGSDYTLKRLREIKSELKTDIREKRSLEADRYLEIMEELERALKRHQISRSGLQIAADDYFLIPYQLSFMKEVLSQNDPVWTNDKAIQKEIEEIITLLGRIGIGFVPVVGNAVDFYEFLTGREFGTGIQLTAVERNFTAIGILAGSGKMWREMAGGVDKTLGNAKLVRKIGKRSAKEAGRTLKKAEEVVGSSIGNKKGETVLGHYPQYVELADKIGARKFDVPMDVWEKMSDAEKWTANRKFLDRFIKRGDDVFLATTPNLMKKGSWFEKEINYLINHGYRISEDGLRLMPSK